MSIKDWAKKTTGLGDSMAAKRELQRAREKLEMAAHDATVGAGNDSEKVDYAKGEHAIGRPMNPLEKRFFEQEWRTNIQRIRQP